MTFSIHAGAPETVRRERRRRQRKAAARLCLTCRKPFSLTVVNHPSGPVIVCRECGATRLPQSARLRSLGPTAG